MEPFEEFGFEVIEANEEKRLPNYNYLYKMFDDIYTLDGIEAIELFLNG